MQVERRNKLKTANILAKIKIHIGMMTPHEIRQYPLNQCTPQYHTAGTLNLADFSFTQRLR